MRASFSIRPRLSALLACLLLAAAGAGRLAAAGLEPSFRLPVGGRAAAAPVIDAGLSPAAIWVLSEDNSLYLLSEAGALLSRSPQPRRPLPFLAVDGAGRALVILPATEGEGALLLAWTRAGRLALRLPLGPAFSTALAASPPSLALGSDGRIFLASGSVLLCFAPSGSLLWSLLLPGGLSAPLAVDGCGRLLVCLAEGRLLVYSPYGLVEARLETASRPVAAGAFTSRPWRDLGLGLRGLPLLALGTADGRLVLAEGGPSVLARLELGSPAVALVSDGQRLFVLLATGRLLALLPSGQVAWTAETGVKGGSLSLFSDRIVATGLGRAVTVGITGAVLREASFANSAAACVVSPQGLLFSPGADWVLGAYGFEAPLGPTTRVAAPPYGDDPRAADESLDFDPEIANASRRLGIMAEIEDELARGDLGGDEGRAGALAAAVARGRFEQDYPSAELRFRQDPLPRSRAVYILGRLGSPERLDVLLEVFLRDSDSSVRAAALWAMGDIGLDPRGELADAFGRAVGLARLDDEVAYALVGAIQALALKSGSPPGRGAVRSLLALASWPYGQDVRLAATKALGRIAGSLGP